MRYHSRGCTGPVVGEAQGVRVLGIPDCEGESSGEHRLIAFKKAITTVQSLFIAYCGGTEAFRTTTGAKKANVYTTKFPNGN